MRNIKIVFTITFASFSFNLFSQTKWIWQNPLPQGNNLNDIQAINQNVVYTVGDMGTVLKTSNGGVDWKILDFPKKIKLIQIKSLNENVGFIAGISNDSVFLYQTNNGGTSWNLYLANPGNQISFHFHDDNHWWLTVDNKVFFSSNGGITWDLKSVLEQISQIYFYNILSGWVIAQNKVYRTTNGGNTWQSFSIELIGSLTLTKIKFINSMVGWVIGTEVGPNHLSGELYKSTDGGQSWIKQLSVGGSFVGYNTFHDIEFYSESLGWATALGIVYRTSDGGNNWEKISEVFKLSQIAVIDSQVLMAAGNNGCLFFSNTSGFEWQAQYTGTFLEPREGYHDLHFINSENGFVGGDNKVLKTTNGGKVWSKIDIDSLNQNYFGITSIWFKDTSTGWIGCTFGAGWGGVFMTTDGGYSWQNQVDNVLRVFDIFFINDSLGWFVSGPDIYFTQNSGKSWTKKSTQTFVAELMSVFFSSPQIGWAGGYHGLIKTTDGGYTWSNITPNSISPYTYDIFFLDENVGWIAANNQYIFHTTDGGINWENQNHFLPPNNFPLGIYFTDRLNGWAVCSGHGGRVLHTTNSGTLWRQIDFPTDKGLYRIKFADKNHGWVLGEEGIILHYLKDTRVSVTNFEIPKKISLYQNFPNPFNSSTTIKFAIPTPLFPPFNKGGIKGGSFVTLKIYDILGREVITLVNEEKLPGDYKVQFTINDSRLTSGVYFYQLRSGDFIATKKMVYLK